jgi:hypothetical protein
VVDQNPARSLQCRCMLRKVPRARLTWIYAMAPTDVRWFWSDGVYEKAFTRAHARLWEDARPRDKDARARSSHHVPRPLSHFPISLPLFCTSSSLPRKNEEKETERSYELALPIGASRFVNLEQFVVLFYTCYENINYLLFVSLCVSLLEIKFQNELSKKIFS